MRIDARTGFFAAVVLLTLFAFAHPTAIAGPESGSAESSTLEQTSPGSPTADRDKKTAEGDGKTSPMDPFVPTETIPADSAISFPVDI